MVVVLVWAAAVAVWLVRQAWVGELGDAPMGRDGMVPCRRGCGRMVRDGRRLCDACRAADPQYTPRPVKVRSCAGCGAPVLGRQAHARFCSPRCADTTWNRVQAQLRRLGRD